MDQSKRNMLALNANKARLLAVQMVHGAASGHPGGSLSIADIITGIFLVFLTTCYKETLISWAAGSGYGNSASELATYILMGIVLVNFAFELVTTTVLSPATKRIIEAIQKTQR